MNLAQVSLWFTAEVGVCLGLAMTACITRRRIRVLGLRDLTAEVFLSYINSLLIFHTSRV
jgi:hypothetical protein